MEGYIRKQALKSKTAQDYLTIESTTEDLVQKRLEEENTNNVSNK